MKNKEKKITKISNKWGKNDVKWGEVGVSISKREAEKIIGNATKYSPRSFPSKPNTKNSNLALTHAVRMIQH